MNVSRFDGLGLAIRQAIAKGNVFRREREQKRCEEEGREARELAAQRELLVNEVLSALPEVITTAVANATKMPVTCTVMFVAPREYMFNVYYDHRYCSTRPEAEPVNLRGDAARVFAELLRAGFSPTLEYGFFVDTDKDYFDSESGFGRQLCICISLQ